MREGFGTLTFNNGDILEGHFVNGHAHGTCIYTFRSGKRRKARYVNGNRISWLNVMEKKKKGLAIPFGMKSKPSTPVKNL